MFDVLVYLYENYWRPQACPEPEQLTRKLSAVGFEDEDIRDALAWLRGLDAAAHRVFSQTHSASMRVYSSAEQDQLGPDCLSFIGFLEAAGVLPAHMREIVVEGVTAIPRDAVSLESFKIVVLMVFWIFGEEPDALILDELLVEPSDRMVH